MKPHQLLFGLLACVTASRTVLAQGTINFTTRFPIAGVDAPLSFFPGGPGVGPEFAAALYRVDGPNLTLIPESITRFRDGSSNPILARYIQSLVVEIPNAPVGSSLTLRIRAWLAAAGSYEQASPNARIETGDFTVGPLGGGANPPADLSPDAQFLYPIGGGPLVPEARPWLIALAGGALIFARNSFGSRKRL